ncbi:CobD/CbiB family protein [Thauera sp.]|jgi:adenosylcobinamide-phosphate synthase|uniref:CobD/CbiB family protein n=1 Tax=Thauera sp. TaxID=1905334 RepID=UPI002A368071|nr:CobD/CbiB family protein [Thauera sp.]MDX9886924.1 CobD/CbiB family protein [Thauera sp.]
MTLFALILALILEQVRPLGAALRVLAPVGAIADGMSRRLNDGSVSHGRVAWLLIVGLSTFATAMAYWLLWELHPLFAFVFNIVVLYLCMGFRHESHSFTEIHLALRMGELDRARTLLAAWRGGRYDEASASEIARLSIEMALVAAHRNLFGVVFWFVILPGPSGAVMYRVARMLAETWGRCRDAEFGAFGVPAQRAFDALDWLPARITATVFSVVGNFEDAVYCWRSQAVLWPERSSAILIASGGGALGVRLGMPVHESGGIVDRPEMGLGSEAGVDHMQSTVGLVWRALLVCLFLLVLLAAAGWVGR